MDPHDAAAMPFGALENHRGARFEGGLIQCDISGFQPQDELLARRLYTALDRARTLAVTTFSERRDLSDQIHDIAQRLGLATRPSDAEASVRRVLHDVRGGSLVSLIFALSDPDLAGAREQRTTRFLASDHMKIMRNAIRGLDGPACERDLLSGRHGVLARIHHE